jgi:putative oxidoreductase
VDLAAALLRLGVGLIFVFAGLEKVIRGPALTADYFASLNIPFPELAAPMISWLELLGGAALLAGLTTRILGFAFTVEMLVALAFARLPSAQSAGGVVEAVAGLRLEMMLALASAALTVLGPGSWAVDAWVRRRRQPGR